MEMTVPQRRKDKGDFWSLDVRLAVAADIPSIARIGSESFWGMRPLKRGLAWVKACFAAAPRTQYWVAEKDHEIVGYILWIEKGGFREQAVLELEQVVVKPSLRGKGVGGNLVTRSLAGVERKIRERGAHLKFIEVTTGTEQHAVDFYRRVLGAEVVARLPNYFRGDEYILVARRKDK